MGGQDIIDKMIQTLKEIVNCSDSEIYTMLVECNMNPNETVMSLLSQDTFHEVKSKRDKKKHTKDQAGSSRRRIPNHGARNSGKDSYNTGQSGGNKFNSNEKRLAQSVPPNKRGNHWGGSSSAPVNSDPKNAEAKKAAPMGSTGAATSSPLSAPVYQSAWVNANPGKKTMAEIVKMGKPLHQKKVIVPRSSETQESGSKAPLKDEESSLEKQDVSGPVSSLLKPYAESKTYADQVSEPQHVADIVKMGRPLHQKKVIVPRSQESGSKAPLKDEESSIEKQGTSGPVSSFLKPYAQSKTHTDQVREPQHVADRVKMGRPLHQKKVIVPCSSETEESGSKAPLKGEGSSLEKQDVTDLVSSLLKPSAESKTHAGQVSEPQHVDESQMDVEVPEKKTNPVASNLDVDQVAQCSHLRFGSFGLRIGSGQASSGFNDILEDTLVTDEDSYFRHLDTNFYGEKEEEELRDNATDEQTSYQIDLTARNYHASSGSERGAAQHEPPQQHPQMQNLENFFINVMDLRDASIYPPGAGQQPASLHQHPALNPYYHRHGMQLGYYDNFTSYPFIPQGYMHSGFQQGLHVGNHQAPLVVVSPPSASLFQQQNENTTAWIQIQRPNLRLVPRGGVHILHVHPNHQPPGFVQAQQLHQQQLSQQAAMSLDQLRHQQSAGEASSQIQELLWPSNNN